MVERINFFAALVEEMAKTRDVKSVHCIQYSGVVNRNGVEYHFIDCSRSEIIFPIKLHRYVLRELKPDVIIVHGFHFPLQVLLLHRAISSAKIIIQHHSERPLRHIKGFLQRLVDKFASAYFFPSIEQAKPWIEQGQIATTKKIHEVTEVPSVFYPIDKEKAKAVTKVDAARMYLWVGRFDTNKDPLTLVKGFIEFARSNQDVRLYVIYQSEELIDEVKSIIDEANELSGKIVLVGKVAHAQLLYWFNSADFIISTSHYEGMGIAVCEAMSCGCIPILSDIPSFREMTDNGTCGLLFSPGDVDHLKNKLIESIALNARIEREKVLEKYSRTMSAAAISKKMISVCEEVLKQR
jgi:glycosyltransferase involved in cell wall biosynthesis